MTEEPQSRARRKALAAARAAARHLPAGLPPAFFLTDPDRTPDPVAMAAGLPAGWGVIYRHFGAEGREDIARALLSLCLRRGHMLLIGADPRLAAAIGADGVHWPGRMAGEARRWTGRFKLQTASAHSRSELGQIGTLPVNAVLFSTVFPSRSVSAGPPAGAIRFRRLAMASPLPVYGLGGVNPDNARTISGFAGVAAVDGWRCFEKAGA